MLKTGFLVVVLCQLFLFGLSDDSSVSKNLASKNINLDDLTDEEMGILLDIINRKKKLEESQTGKCHFKRKEQSIIRATESLANGATFLNASTSANSTEKCEKTCCEISKCDFAVFQEPEENERDSLCYLFSCTLPNGDFVCTTAQHHNYVVFTRDRPLEQESDLLDVANDAMVQHEIPSKSEPSQNLITDLNAVMSTNLTSTLSTTTLSTSTSTTTTTARTLQPQPNVTKTITTTSTVKPQSIELQASETCLLKLDVGECSQKSVRYYFNVVQNACEEFEYTGCDGNANNFQTIEMCEETCDDFFIERTETDESVILPLALGLIVTGSVLLMVACRLRIMKNKLKRRGKPISVDESDYLINGMYL